MQSPSSRFNAHAPFAALALSASLLASTDAAADGLVRAWGWNAFGQSSVPASLGNCSAISAGTQHSAALTTGGTVVCWGDDDYNQCAVPATLGTATKISLGGYHSMAIKASGGTVVCWGLGTSGQCTVPSDLGSASQIGAGGYHSLAIKSTGSTVFAWGLATSGQCTIPSTASTASRVAGGWKHSMALKSTGTVVCWGSNTYGESTVPSGLSSVTRIAAGDYFSVAVRSNGSVVVWGNAATTLLAPPSDLPGIEEIAAGFEHIVAVSSTGVVRAWGSNFYGQATVPSNIGSGQVSAAGYGHSMVIVTPTDNCPNDPNKTEPGQCGCGVPDTDSDGDGTADCNDLVFNKTLTGGTIPNNSTAGLSMPFTVPSGYFTDGVIEVRITLSGLAHIFAGDLVCELVSPDGTKAYAFYRVGQTSATSPGDSSNYSAANSYSFGDLYTSSLWAAAAAAPGTSDNIASGLYYPTEQVNPNPVPMAPKFAGHPLAGQWTLRVKDIGVGEGAGGTLASATVVLVPGADQDDDGIPDATDNCVTVANPTQANADGDSRGDACDNCPTVSNSTQTNSDNDALGDACDNCPNTTNSNQANADGDSAGDACDGCPSNPAKTAPGQCGCSVPDTDSDGDGTADCDDTTYNPTITGGTVPNNSANGLQKTFTVPAGMFTAGIESIRVDFTGLSHQHVGDLFAELVGPSGAKAYLFYRIGKTDPAVGTGDDSNFAQSLAYRFGDTYTGDVWANAATANGTAANIASGFFRPSGQYSSAQTGLASAFAGQNLVGTWILRVSDIGSGESSGGSYTSALVTFVKAVDTDGDGVTDGADNCPTIANANQADADSDLRGDACDNCASVANASQSDGDGDARGDACDNCPTESNASQANADGDSAGDACDNCPTVSNSSQADADDDGIGTACDNCATDFNPYQENADGDGSGDACDGCPADSAKTSPGVCGCGVADTDSDTDGTPDCQDSEYGRTFAGGSIPNNSSTGLTRTFTIPAGMFTAGFNDVRLTLTGLSHSFVGDLAVTLVSPGGTTATVFSRIGKTSSVSGSGDDSDFSAAQTYQFADGNAGDLWNAAASVGSTTAVPGGSYFSSAPLTGAQNVLAASFTGPQTVGTWTIRIADLGTGESSGGSITSIGLTLVKAADSDSDGVTDAVDNCPLAGNASQADLDGDGDGDACDNCATVSNASQSDVDSDGRGDACDNCPAAANASQSDVDSDGRGDACDNCVAASNASQADADSDGRGDACDNCPSIANASQANSDGDAAGDACDGCPSDGQKTAPGECGCGVSELDSDGDGVPDCVDDTIVRSVAGGSIAHGSVTGLTRTFTVPAGAFPAGLADIEVEFTGLSHSYAGDLIAELTAPSGLKASIFSRIGRTSSVSGNGDDSDFSASTVYRIRDTATASLWSAAASAGATSAITGGSYYPTAALSGTKVLMAPILNGGATSGTWTIRVVDSGAGEFSGGSVGSIKITLVKFIDGDGDGIADAVDNCPGVANATQADGDGDGVGSACDNCPTASNATQSNSDGDAAGDACDGCPSNPAKTAAGQCGCSEPDTDSDGDGTADCVDTTFAATLAGGAIPNNSAAGFERSFVVPEGLVTAGLDDVKVAFTGLAHPFVGELECELVAPDGRIAPVFRRIGATTPEATGDNSNFLASRAYRFADSFVASVWTAAANAAGTNAGLATGNYFATDALSSARVLMRERLAGAAMAGTWRLRVRDVGATDAGNGNIASVVVTLTRTTDVDEDGVGDSSDNCPAASNPSQDDADGDGKGDACDGCPSDPLKSEPGVCGCGAPDLDSDGDGLKDCVDDSFDATLAGGTIPNANANGLARTFTVPAGYLGTGLVDVRVTFTGLAHTHVGDLRCELTSPGGVVVTVFDRIGRASASSGTGDSSNLGAGQSYRFADSHAASIWAAAAAAPTTSSIVAGGAYFASVALTGDAVSMSGAFNAASRDGLWRFRIVDAASGSTAAGTFTNVKVALVRAGAPGRLAAAAPEQGAVALDGYLADGVLSVPGEFASAQDAIDALPVGGSAIVQLAAGVFDAPVDFRGKAIVLRGAGIGQTVLDGRDAQVAPGARMVDLSGTPASAMLCDLTIRRAPFGAVRMVDGAARIERVRFEENTAETGGAIEFVRSEVRVDSCEFVGNESAQGGCAISIEASTGVLRECSFDRGPCESLGRRPIAVLGDHDAVSILLCEFDGRRFVAASASERMFGDSFDGPSGLPARAD